MNKNINEVIQTSAMSGFQVTAITICLMVNMLDGFDVLVMAFTASSVSSEWDLAGSQLGVLLSAGLFGMAGGSLFLAPMADKYGRRNLVLTSLLIISVGMILSSFSQSLFQLAIMRVFTGLGIGAMLASLNVIVAEYSSNKWRSFAVSALQTGYPIGAVVGGVIAAFLISEFGWRSVFLFGGVASLLMIPVVYFKMPESLDFLLLKRPQNALEKVNHLLRHMGHAEVNRLPEISRAQKQLKSGVRSLFSARVQRATVLSWSAFFMVMFSFYFVLSWTPKLLVSAGLSPGEGISAGVLINLGGVVGGLVLGYLSSKLLLKRLLGFYMVCTALVMVLFGLFSSTLTLALALGVIIGFFLFGSMIGLYALVPTLYPPSIRVTGMGWAIGMGRLGAILSPFIAGLLLDSQWQSTSLFVVFAVPLLVSTVLVKMINVDSSTVADTAEK